jgi:sterol desaturase/sphingolipid hydroxylase (fatty acid hydroxylase superfamily)
MFEFLNTASIGQRGLILGLALLFVAAEFAAAKLSHHDDQHDVNETMASFGVAFGHFIIRTLTAGLVALPFFIVYQHRLFDIPQTGVWPWLALFLGVEFCYYWFHRCSHQMRWFWATHSVHHSAEHFNLSAAVRLGWTGELTGAAVFFLPLVLAGFHPVAIAAVVGLGLLYQFFLHTSFSVNLGPLEWILNTPSHHRVHHASNDACLDRNYGSMLIIFDRLFGTFAEAPADEKLVFGLKGKATGNNPIAIAFGEWVRLFQDVKKARGIRAKLGILIAPP